MSWGPGAVSSTPFSLCTSVRPLPPSTSVYLSVGSSLPAPAPHTSPLLSSLPPDPLVTLLSITITQNRRIFYYLVSLLNQVLCPLFFIFEVDECHTIFSHQKAKAEQSGQDGPKVISPTGRCSLRRWGVFSWATGMLPESESPESQYSRGNISREALGLGPVLSWEPVANGDRLRHRGKAWEGPLHPGAQARDLHHHHKSQGEESGIQKRNESLQPPISEPGPKRPRDLLSE